MSLIKTPILLDLPMPIVTKRLILRPIQASDGKAIFAAVEESRENLEKWLPWPKYTKNWEDSEQYARECHGNFILRNSMHLGIFKDDKYLGNCGFNYFLWEFPATEIGYWLRVSAQKKGYMQEAVSALVEYGFKNMHMKRMVITCFDDNYPSANIAEKLGFSLETRTLGLIKSLQDDNLVMCRRYVKFSI